MVPAPVPAAVPVVSTQIPATSSSASVTSLQSVGGKQLVHILPRPIQPQMNHPLQASQASSSPPVPPAPQTITVNGQVFALQPMKTSDKPSSQGGQSTLQLVQPTTTEEPTTNVALNSLGALSSLNQSISQGLPLTISNQNNGQPPATPSSVVQQKQPIAPASVPGTTLALPARQLQVPLPVRSGLVVTASKPAGKRLRTRAAAKRTKPAKKKELSQAQPAAVVVSAKPVAAAEESQTVQHAVSEVLQSSTVKVTDVPPTSTATVTTTESSEAIANVTSTQNNQVMIASSSSNESTVRSQSHLPSKSSVSATPTDVILSHTNTSGVATAVTANSTTSVKPSVSAAVVVESKQAAASGNHSTVARHSVPEVKQATTSSATGTTQSKSAATAAVSRPSKSAVSSAGTAETRYTSTTVSAACPTAVCTSSIAATTPASLNQVTQPTSVCHTQAPLPCNKPLSQTTTSPLVSATVALSSPAATPSTAHSSVTAPTTSSEFRKRVTTSRAPTQQTDVSMPNPSPCHPTEVKPPQPPRRDREAQVERHSTVAEKEGLVAATSDTPSRKDFALSQQVYTNLDDQTIEHSMTSNRQTDSPMSTGAGGGRGFSVASMLPQGHSISASSGSFGTFTFTSEQAEMLALAMLEQDSPGRRSGGCSGDNTTSANPTTATWEPPKTPPVSSSKERASAGQQTKVTKPMDTVTVKPSVQVSVRGQAGEGSVSGPNGSRHPQNITYSQSHSLPQVQSQSSSQSGTVASLSVNNLIRPSSTQQPYPGSPSLAGQQGSVPSPAGTSAHIPQTSNNALSPCSGAGQLNEYTPSALMRAQAGVGVAERQVKIISKRQAQEEVMLNTGKRPKPCPPSATTVSHMEVKAPDHSQMMVGQLPPTSVAVMARINPESAGPLFSTNSFMSPVVRPTDGHCPPQGPPEQNQPAKSSENNILTVSLPQPGQDHNAMQRMMSSRTLEQQLISPPSNPVSRSSDLACAPSRQERHRVSNYSAEALIGKSSTSGEQQQRMGLHLQPGRGATQEQQDLRGYLDTSRGKANIAHNPQNRLPSDHPGSADVQRVSECPPFKAMGGGGAHQLGGFEAQVSRGSDMAPKSVPPSQRGPQGQQQGGFRMAVGPPADGRNRGGYSAAHPGSQGIQVGPALPREQEGCHQSFMQSLLSPHLPEQSNHQRVQCCPPVSMEYSCVPGSSSGDIQAKSSSPSVPQTQKAPAMRLGEGNKGHISQVSSNMHGGPGVRTGLPHPPTPHSSSEPGRSSAPSRPPTAVSQHSRHIARETQPTKLRPGDRARSGTLRHSNPFEPEGHLSLPSGGGVLLSRPQSGGEARRSTIVRFMADSAQVPSDNNLVPDQHLTQNFGFPFIPEGGMNPPPPINANSTFIPPVSQPNASRTPSLLPVEPQNTLPSFYPSYSPAAHPSLPSDVTLQYFPNQMFTSPSADKGSAPPLNNRFGSILSPPRPVGFGQASFPLLPDMPPMPIANSSGITPHISNFSLTSLFPEIATGMPTDGSAMPMSPLLSLSNTSSADSGKQPNRPAHNISHILGHDGSSAV
ncbi:Basic helix-loop-helix domain-containing protein USF3 [Nibea albiflora]|uniref:Basic helix-loop-helix domain-containing protein USF3 n=1 Tax=Nibea albiflora TaxID=240163 RepID=A0ACB7F4N0_NIBAL|nr:Basic helix-loop-helix domain-containing protein USF3 [Nibea albiflora]